jgi:hypothetical protein
MGRWIKKVPLFDNVQGFGLQTVLVAELVSSSRTGRAVSTAVVSMKHLYHTLTYTQTHTIIELHPYLHRGRAEGGVR